MKIRPLSDWLLVRLDPRAKRSGIIEIAGDNDTSAVRTGTILRAGPGKDGIPLDAKVEDRIAFLRWHDEHRPGKAISEALRRAGSHITEDVMMIRQSDILFFFEGDVEVDIG